MSLPQRLARNNGGYHGETISIDRVLREIGLAAVNKKWTRDADFLAYRREPPAPRRRVYISAGIHGDEPAGPLAMRRLIEEDRWPADFAIFICPCLNPSGLALNRRENAQGLDLNRDFRHFAAEETRAHIRWFERQPNFDFALCLHEDWESNGFYLYELNPDGCPSPAEKIIDAVEKVCPIDHNSTIEGWEAENGIIRPALKPEERPLWPEALYLITNKTRQSCTLEAPSDFALEVRVAALTAGVRAVLAQL